MKITLFTTCAPFKGDWGAIQKIALNSWRHLCDTDIVVLGKDEGVAEICQEYGFHHIPDVLTGEDIGVENSGGIVMGDGWAKIREFDSDVKMFINADNILIPSTMLDIGRPLNHILETLIGKFGKNFAGWGRRRDCENYHDLICDDVDLSVSKFISSFKKDPDSFKRIRPGIDVYVWSDEVFQNIELLPIVCDGWGYDVWLATAMKEATSNLFLTHNIMDTIHPKHPESSNHQVGVHKFSTTHNKNLLSKWRNINIWNILEASPAVLTKENLEITDE